MISSAGNWHLVHSLRVAYRAHARTVLPPPSLARQHGVSILNQKFTVYVFASYICTKHNVGSKDRRSLEDDTN